MKITRKKLKILIESYIISEWGEEVYGIEGADSAPQQSRYAGKSVFSFSDASEIVLGILPVTGTTMNAINLGKALYEIYETGGDEGKMDAAFSALGLVLPAAGKLGKVGSTTVKVASKIEDVHTAVGTILTTKDKMFDKKSKLEKIKSAEKIAKDLIANSEDLKNKIRPV